MKFLQIKEGKIDTINYFSEPYFTKCINIAESAINNFCKEKGDEPVERDALIRELKGIVKGTNPTFRVNGVYFYVKSIIENYVEADGFSFSMKGENLENFINEELMDLDLTDKELRDILLVFIMVTDYPLLYLLSILNCDIKQDVINSVAANISYNIEYILEEINKAKVLEKENK